MVVTNSITHAPKSSKRTVCAGVLQHHELHPTQPTVGRHPIATWVRVVLPTQMFVIGGVEQVAPTAVCILNFSYSEYMSTWPARKKKFHRAAPPVGSEFVPSSAAVAKMASQASLHAPQFLPRVGRWHHCGVSVSSFLCEYRSATVYLLSAQKLDGSTIRGCHDPYLILRRFTSKSDRARVI